MSVENHLVVLRWKMRFRFLFIGLGVFEVALGALGMDLLYDVHTGDWVSKVMLMSIPYLLLRRGIDDVNRAHQDEKLDRAIMASLTSELKDEE